MGHEHVVKDAPALHEARLIGPNNLRKVHLNPASENLCQDLIYATQEGNGPPVVQSNSVPKFGDESNYTFVDVGQGHANSEKAKSRVDATFLSNS